MKEEEKPYDYRSVVYAIKHILLVYEKDISPNLHDKMNHWKKSIQEELDKESKFRPKDEHLSCMPAENPSLKDDVEYSYEPEEQKSGRMTYRMLSEWLAKGNGEVILLDTPTIKIEWRYDIKQQNKEVSSEFVIRKWGSNKWIQPTVDIYEADCKEE